MMTPLLRAIHVFRRSSSASARSPVESAIATGAETPIAAIAAKTSQAPPHRSLHRPRDGSGTCHDEQQVLGVQHVEHDARAERLQRREPSSALIHFGIVASSPSSGLPRHCLAARAMSTTPRASLSADAAFEGLPSLLVPEPTPAATSSPPTIAVLTTLPATYAIPFT